MKRRAAATALTALAVALTLSGCAFITPQQTTASYQASDGVNGSIGGVDVRNAMLISTTGTDGNLVAVFINTGDAPKTVKVQYASDGSTTAQSVVVPANASVQVKPETDSVLTLSSIDAPLGSLFNVSFVVGSASQTLGVPVLNTSLPGYSTLAPTATPTATPTSTPGATLSPAPTASATPEDTLSPSPSATP